MQLFSIETGSIKLDGGAMFGVVPKVLWQKQYPADENNLCEAIIRSLLIVDGDRKILIDTGMGDKQDEKFKSIYHLHGDADIIKSLGANGFVPEAITDVILTHLHFDHCGGAVKYNADRTGFEYTFPNATYYISSKHWEWAINPNRREAASFLKDNILPIKEGGRLKLLDNEGEILPNVSVKFYYGHTEAQVIPFVNYHGRTVVFMGDLLAFTGHVALPYIPSYDVRPLVTLQEKETFYKEAIENNYVLFFEHDSYNECCTLHHTDKGVKVKEVFSLSEFIKVFSNS